MYIFEHIVTSKIRKRRRDEIWLDTCVIAFELGYLHLLNKIEMSFTIALNKINMI